MASSMDLFCCCQCRNIVVIVWSSQVDRPKKSFDEEGKLLNKESLLERLVEWLYNPQETKVYTQSDNDMK